MTTSTTQILELSTSEPTAMAVGSVAAARRFSRPTRSQLDLLADLEVRDRSKVERHRHPAQEPGAQPPSREQGLQPSELVWLQRIPSDPEQVSFQDAVELAALTNTVDSGKHPADARLLRSVYAPVKALHDRRQAETELRNAKLPLADVPSSAVSALADAIAQEVPDLTPDEVMNRAGDLLAQTLAEREATRQRTIAQAEGRIAAIDAAEAERTAVTR